MIPAMRTLKIQTFNLADCQSSLCSSAAYTVLPTPFPLNPELPVRCICSPTDTCDPRLSPYSIFFSASLSGFYRLSVTGAGVPVGPIVVPVVAGPVVAANTVAYGPGLFEAFATEQTEFYVQPRDAYGNYHSSGIHVFQVAVSGASPYYQQAVVPTDSGKGFSVVLLDLEYPQARPPSPP
jgi:hypothetical protein